MLLNDLKLVRIRFTIDSLGDEQSWMFQWFWMILAQGIVKVTQCRWYQWVLSGFKGVTHFDPFRTPMSRRLGIDADQSQKATIRLGNDGQGGRRRGHWFCKSHLSIVMQLRLVLCSFLAAQADSMEAKHVVAELECGGQFVGRSHSQRLRGSICTSCPVGDTLHVLGLYGLCKGW